MGEKLLAGLRILVADSRIDNRLWLREQLSILGGKSVALAATAADLMRNIKSEPFDVVVCDQFLDEKRNGLYLLEELRLSRLFSHKSIFMVASVGCDYSQVVSAAGFAPDDYLVKPFVPSQLENRLKKALQKKLVLKGVLECLDEGDHEGVVRACNKVVDSFPPVELEALHLKAGSLVVLGRVEEAAALYGVVAKTRNAPWAYLGHAAMMLHQQKTEDAKEVALWLIRNHPDFLSAHQLLTRIHEANGAFGEALGSLEKVATVASSCNSETLRKIADFAEATGARSKAISTLEILIDRLRHSSTIKADDYLSLARLLLAERRMKEAKSLGTRMFVDTKHLPAGALASEVVASMVFRHNGKLPAARSCLENAFRLLNDDPSSLNDAVLIELCEESSHHGMLEHLVMPLAKLANKPYLPASARVRLAAWFGPEFNAPADGDGQVAAGDFTGRAGQPELGALGRQIVSGMEELVRELDEHWSEALARHARRRLIGARALMPRNTTVVDGLIRYNLVALREGGELLFPEDGSPVEGGGELAPKAESEMSTVPLPGTPKRKSRNISRFIRKAIKYIEDHGIDRAGYFLKRAALDSKGERRTIGIIEAIAAYGVRSGGVAIFDAAVMYGADLDVRPYGESVSLRQIVKGE